MAPLRAEIADALSRCPTEDGLESFLDSLGIGLLPDEDGGEYQGWLRAVLRRVESAMAPKPEESAPPPDDT